MMDSLGGPNLITWVLISRGAFQKEVWLWKNGQRGQLGAVMEDGGIEPWAIEGRQPLEGGRGKETDLS